MNAGADDDGQAAFFLCLADDSVNSFYKNSAMGSYSIDSAGGSNYCGQLSDAELKNVLELESLLSKEETDKIIRDCKYFAFPDTAILENTAIYSCYIAGEFYILEIGAICKSTVLNGGDTLRYRYALHVFATMKSI